MEFYHSNRNMTKTGFACYISGLCPLPCIIHTCYLPQKAQVSVAFTSLTMQVCDLALEEEDQCAGDAGGIEAEVEGTALIIRLTSEEMA